jgi:hypothetical protein
MFDGDIWCFAIDIRFQGFISGCSGAIPTSEMHLLS